MVFQERHRIKALLAQEESMVPALFNNLRRALIPLMHTDTYIAMQSVAAKIESQGRNPRNRLPAPKAKGKREPSSAEKASEEVLES